MINKIGFVETPIEIANLMIRLSNIKKDSLILDTGCGKGIFLKALKDKGYENVYGIEIDRSLYNYCKEKFGRYFKIINENFLTYKFSHSFDLIIGNPPYIHFKNLSPDIAKIVKDITKTSKGDIYYAFIIRSISLLKEKGELIYIVPYHFLYNTYAKYLREKLLENGKIEIIIDLDETRLFNGENPETIIFKFIKGSFDIKKEKIMILNIKNKKSNSSLIYEKAIKSITARKNNELFVFKKIPHFIESNVWSTFYINLPRTHFFKLKEIAKIGVGLVSGFDKAFIVKNPKNLNKKEKKLIKKFVKGKHCKRFIVEGYESYIVIEDTIKDEEELKNKYPNIYQELIPFKSKMHIRYLPKGKRWFNWQALRNYKFLKLNIDKKRIYVPSLDRHPYNRFSLGDKALLPSGDVLFIQPLNQSDLYFLLGYLNSSFFRKYYLQNGGRRGGRISFTQKLLEDSEIPSFPEKLKKQIETITEEIVLNLHNRKDTSYLEKYLDDIIFSHLS